MALKPSVEFCPDCGARMPRNRTLSLCPVCSLKAALPTSSQSSPPSVAPESSPPLLGDYQLLEEIARGGMGIVWKARQISLNRIVALKMILSGRFASKEEILRFRAEAEAAANLHHPNIVAIYETGEEDGQPYFSMEFVEGSNLTTLVRDGPLPPKRAARYVLTIAEAIHYAHEKGILHRDIKPSNVLIDLEDRPKITDFGLAKRVQQQTFLTVTGQVLGSPNFMPPEQCGYSEGGLNRKPRTKAGRYSDVYSLGGLLFYLLTGRAAFIDETIPELLQQILKTEPISPALLNPNIPPDLATICLKCLEKEPTRRYPTARDLAEELDRYLNLQPILTRPLSPLGKTIRWSRRNPAVATFASATLLLLLIIAIGATLTAFRIRSDNKRLLQNLYAADIKLVEHYLGEGNLGRVQQLLKTYDHPAFENIRGFEWGYYRQLSRGNQIVTLAAHTNGVTALVFRPSDHLLTSASFDNHIKTFTFPSLQLTYDFTFGEINPTALQYSPDAKLIAAATVDQGVFLWDAAAHKLISHLPGPWTSTLFGPNDSLIVSQASAYQPGHPGTVALWNPSSSNIIALPIQGDRLAYSPASGLLFVSSGQDSIHILNLPSRQILRTIPKTGNPTSLTCSPDGQHLLGATSSGDLLVWVVSNGTLKHQLKGHSALTWQATFSPDGSLIASASSDQTIRLWEMETGRHLHTLRGHGNEVWCVQFSPDGKQIISGDKDGHLLLWNIPESRPPSLPSIDYMIGSPIFSADSSLLAIGTGNHIVQIFDLHSHQVRHTIPGADCPISFSPGANTISVLTGAKIRHLDLRSLSEISSVPISPPLTNFEALAISPRYLASAHPTKQVDVWDLDTGILIHSIQLEESFRIRSLTFAPHSDALAILGWDLSEILLFTRRWEDKITLRGHKLDVWSVDFSRDGALMASASMDDTAKLWHIPTRRLLHTFSGHREGASGVAISPDSKTLAVHFGAQHKIKLWNLPTYRELADLASEPGSPPTSSLQFSPDSQTLLSWWAWYPYANIKLWHSTASAQMGPGKL